MNKKEWEIFNNFKKEFSDKINEWTNKAPELKELQKEAVIKAKAPLYSFETTVVYNRALDDIKESDNIRLIVIGDNPGKDEQLLKNNKYLVGQAGKIAEGYFKRNSELGVDFRKDVIILNKTPIHSGKTNQLKTIAKNGGEKIQKLIEESQLWMAEKTAKLHCDLCNVQDNDKKTELWLVGYAELKNKGIFIKYKDKLLQTYNAIAPNVWNNVYVFQHFSMNRFTIDLASFIEENNYQGKLLIDNIHTLGAKHKKEIFLM